MYSTEYDSNDTIMEERYIETIDGNVLLVERYDIDNSETFIDIYNENDELIGEIHGIDIYDVTLDDIYANC